MRWLIAIGVVAGLAGCVTSVVVGSACCASCLGGCAALTTPGETPAPLSEVGP